VPARPWRSCVGRYLPDADDPTGEGVSYQGALVSLERKYSDRLMVQLLKAYHPAQVL
jgi:hypothetical protein